MELESRIRGCLMGSAIGAELGLGRLVNGAAYDVDLAETLDLMPEPVLDWAGEKGRIDDWRATPLIDLGVRTYLSAGGRATPEDFAAFLKDDAGVAVPAFKWDGLHSTQEVLKEGMHPRIAGLGSAPCGNVCACMPAVGIYHFNDAEYAYLDGVELASVVQPRLGADWAGLCAAAVAAAFEPGAKPEAISDTVLKFAHRNNKDLFYEMNSRVRSAVWASSSMSEAQFVGWWAHVGGSSSVRNEEYWYAYNPLVFVLPLLRRFCDEPRKLMAVLLKVRNHSTTISPVLAGAILGAMGGEEVFPEEWRKWAEPISEPWFVLSSIVGRRVRRESEIISVVERLRQESNDGESILFDKIHGCMLAGAIGNAMGSVVEGQFYWEVDARHPGGITTILDPSRLEGEDDNQMAMLLVETYLERDGLPVMARHFGHTWCECLNRHHFYMNCMGNAYDMMSAGWDPRVTGHWSVVTGSTVMCMEPVGVYHLADPEYAMIDATAISYMYQRGLDVTAASILSAAVAEALKLDATVDSVLAAAVNAAPTDRLNTFDVREFESPRHYIETCLKIAEKYEDVLAVRHELYEKCLFYHMIDPLELLGYALAMFKIAGGDIRQAAIGGTNIGRDSDTIAGRAAMLSGALMGAGSVPAEWVALCTPESLERIRTNARRLAECIATKKLARLHRRQGAAVGIL
jgi:ADP-ribosylglycohydrolase